MQADIHFGTPKLWVPAKSLINDAGIYIENRRQVTYYHILLSGHEILIPNGQPAESFFLGDVARNVLTTHERREVAQFFPEMATSPVSGTMQSARMMLKPAEAQFLAHAMVFAGAVSFQTEPGRILAP